MHVPIGVQKDTMSLFTIFSSSHLENIQGALGRKTLHLGCACGHRVGILSMTRKSLCAFNVSLSPTKCVRSTNVLEDVHGIQKAIDLQMSPIRKIMDNHFMPIGGHSPFICQVAYQSPTCIIGGLGPIISSHIGSSIGRYLD